MPNNLVIKSNAKPEKQKSGEVVHRDIYFFTCIKCKKSRRQSLKEKVAGELVCRKCRSIKTVPGQTSLFNPEGLPLCPKCEMVLHPIIENSGFDEPEGPSHFETVGYECKNCGYVER